MLSFYESRRANVEVQRHNKNAETFSSSYQACRTLPAHRNLLHVPQILCGKKQKQIQVITSNFTSACPSVRLSNFSVLSQYQLQRSHESTASAMKGPGNKNYCALQITYNHFVSDSFAGPYLVRVQRVQLHPVNFVQ